jgi:hypothetical protein
VEFDLGSAEGEQKPSGQRVLGGSQKNFLGNSTAL